MHDAFSVLESNRVNYMNYDVIKSKILKPVVEFCVI